MTFEGIEVFVLLHRIGKPLWALFGVIPFLALRQPPIPGKPSGPGALGEPSTFFVIDF